MVNQKLFSEMMDKMEGALSEERIDVVLCESLNKKDFEVRQLEQTAEHGQILYLLNGTIECKCIDGKGKRVHANESLLIPAGMPHCMKIVDDENFSAIYVQFRTTRFEISRCIYACDRNLRILWIFETLRDEFKGEYCSVMIRRYLFGTALLMMLKVQHEADTKITMFDRAVMYLRTHINEKINIDELAKMLYVSPSYLCRLFQKRAHKTVMHYLRDMRINEAKQYLEESNYGIEEIAFRTGFASPKYFTKKFKELVGMPPSVFRKKFE